MADSPQARRFASSKWTGDTLAPTRFADGFPLLLLAQASLDDLNLRAAAHGWPAFPANRFRPNIMIDGIAAFEEEYAASYAVGGDILLRPVKPCPRCPIPSIDQASGVAGNNPLDLLQTYRANPRVDGEITFGMNVIVEHGAGRFLHVGDALELEIAF